MSPLARSVGVDRLQVVYQDGVKQLAPAQGLYDDRHPFSCLVPGFRVLLLIVLQHTLLRDPPVAGLVRHRAVRPPSLIVRYHLVPQLLHGGQDLRGLRYPTTPH